MFINCYHLNELMKLCLYSRRFNVLRSKDANFKERWKHLGELQVQSAFNWDDEIEPDLVSELTNNT